jgi:type II secretory ATPase GspE/PulE/Tfp pilus assembly ATPase PilB-like protein
MRHLEIPLTYSSPVVSRIKIMASLDIAERRLPQDGKIKFVYKNKPVELRVATLPTVAGEDVVLRILASAEAMPLEALHLSESDYTNLKEIISRPYGIILVVGPTGSGKTTTLHAALAQINTPEKKIWTAEDPVEITQEGLRQVEVKPKIEFDFARAMRSFLRANPDVIMVGEMRDRETAHIGIEASLTGHLVLSTLHTNSAPETITRLIDMGIDPLNFADSILGILAQRLVRTLCKKCKEPYHPEREEFESLSQSYGERFPQLGIVYDDKLTLYKPKGCDECNQSGYKGRAGVYELLIGTKDIKRVIAKRGTVEEIRQQAIKDGMRTLYQDGIAKVFSGLTTYKQVRSVCIQ